MSCCVGGARGLVDQLSNVSLVTTISFQLPVPAAHIVPGFARFAGCFTLLLLQYYSGNTNVLEALASFASKHDCSLFSAVEILSKYKVLQYSEENQLLDGDTIMDDLFKRALYSPDVPELTELHCSPLMRNPLGYHDPDGGILLPSNIERVRKPCTKKR